MIRSLHISNQNPIETLLDSDLFEFTYDVFLNHIPDTHGPGCKISAMFTRQGVDMVVDSPVAVTKLLTSAGFSVRDLGKVRV